MITQALNLNLIPGQVLPRVNVSQYDSGTRTLQMSLYNGTQAFNVTSGVLGFIQGTKPDRTGFQYSATVTSGSNVVTADITQQMTAVSGDVVTELVLVSGDDQIATVNFIIHVEAAALADDTVISETELPLIEEAAELAERIDGIIAQIDADADKSEAYAVGTKGGTPVPATDPTYHNNSKYYSEQAAASAASIGDLAADAEAWAVGTRDGSAVPSTDPAYHNNSKYYAQDAGDKATDAGTSATSASTNALKAEGFAVGEQNGTAVTSGSPYYHNNAEYFAGEASTSATNASTSETNAGLSESAAAQSEEDSEAWAIGERNGVPVTSGDPTYQNNAKYYAQQAGGTALSSLVDVAISGATNGQVLGYNSTSQKWENESLGSAAAKNSTNAVTSGSTDLVESGAVYTEIDSINNDLSNKLYTKKIMSVADMPASKDFYDLDDGFYYVAMAVINSNQTVNTPPILGGCELLVARNGASIVMETCFPFDTKYPILNGWSNTNSAAFKWTAKLFSNPNLLDNPFFTVNQRGQTSYSNGTGYCLDRWKRFSALAVTINSDGSITVTNTGSGDAYIGQVQEADILIGGSGKRLTWSADISATDGNSYMYAGYTDSSDNYHGILNGINLPTSRGIVSGSATLGAYSNITSFQNMAFCIKANSSITIHSVKLETGNVSTLSLDAPPNYAEELLKCQRYCVALNPSKIPYSMVGSGFAYSTTEIDFIIPVPVTMRVNPSAVDLTNWRVTDGSNWTSIDSISLYRNAGSVKAVLSGLSGLTQGKPYFIAANNNSELMLITADL